MADRDYFQTCCECGIVFAVPESFDKWCRADARRNFYCPRGHSMHYSGKDNDLERMRRERDRLKQETAYLSDRYRQAEEAKQLAEHSAAAYKGHLTRTKRRLAHGVCPCCKRTFQNLRDHMRKQHPEFEADETVVDLKRA